MAIKLVMQEWPEGVTVLRELYLVRMQGEGIVKQVQTCFSRREAEDLARCLNRNIGAGTADVLGPYLVQGE